MCPQSGDGRFALTADLPPYGVPGPLHVTGLPSPNFHTTFCGRATAVTDTPGTDAIADLLPQLPRASHNHVGRCTSCSLAGLARMTGDGSRNCSRAC
ncbi:hypothetical protein [Streptomyces sp. ODS28]|uniref:hypothetical protein n=1 Tax=Streptomyces sp. ODS28 TaxID=3136688 RepID=UPI0031ED019A